MAKYSYILNIAIFKQNVFSVLVLTHSILKRLYLSIYIFNYLSIYLSICLPACLPACLSIYIQEWQHTLCFAMVNFKGEVFTKHHVEFLW